VLRLQGNELAYRTVTARYPRLLRRRSSRVPSNSHPLWKAAAAFPSCARVFLRSPTCKLMPIGEQRHYWSPMSTEHDHASSATGSLRPSYHPLPADSDFARPIQRLGRLRLQVEVLGVVNGR